MNATINRDLASLRKSVESIDAAKCERIETASYGDVVRQGDLYLVCLSGPCSGEVTKDHQLAPGTTQGSRHVADENCIVRIGGNVAEKIKDLYPDVPTQLIGPSVECLKDTKIAHPEHGDWILTAGSNWGVVYQRAYAEEIRRVVD